MVTNATRQGGIGSMSNEAHQEEGSDYDSVNDEGRAPLRSGALAVNGWAYTPKDAGTIDRERGA
jgi:hypothetical protein